MIISETFSVAGPRDLVSAMLLDVQQISACVPGVSGVKRTSGDRFEATLSVQVGPIRSSFRGAISIDGSAGPGHLVATARGKDGASGSLATVKFDAHLDESAPGLTTIEVTADVSIRGRLGSFGTGVIQAIAKQTIDEFVACLNARVASDGLGAAPEARPRLSIWRAVWDALVARLKRIFGSRDKRADVR